jgi:hypothetical protein
MKVGVPVPTRSRFYFLNHMHSQSKGTRLNQRGVIGNPFVASRDDFATAPLRASPIITGS